MARPYRRLGPRYPSVVVIAALGSLYAIFLVSVSVPLLYTDPTAGQVLRLLAFIVVQQTLYTYVFWRFFRRYLSPLTAWLRAPARGEAAAAAWRAAAGAPPEYLRRIIRFVAPLWGSLAFSLYATWELDLDVVGFVTLLAGSALAGVYAIAAFFLTIERAFRPILRDIDGWLEEPLEDELTGVPLRWRLLAFLPAVSLVTGVVVASITAQGEAGFDDFGLAILVSLAVASTVALWQSAMLSDSV